MINHIAKAELNITYNYSEYYYKELDRELGIKWLDRKKASACIKRLEMAIEALGTERCIDYWEPAKGNAGYALSILLEWAQQHPDGEYRVN